MKRIFLPVFPLVLIGIFMSASTAAAGHKSEVSRVLDALSARQAGIRTVRAAFRQEKQTALLPRPVRSKGSVDIAYGRGVRWVYEGAMAAVYDGKTLWVHHTELGVVDKIRGAEGLSVPLSFDVGSIIRDYEVDAEEDPLGGVILILKPRGAASFASMRMEFPPGAAFPERAVVAEAGGDTTTIIFTDVRTNISMDPKLFEFAAPPGVEVRERPVGAE